MAESHHAYLGERFGLEGKVALVTGARQGLGHAIAKALAHAGARVAVTARRPAELAPVVGELEELGEPAAALGLDVRDPRQVEAAVTATVEQLGGLDVLVNNAGVAVPADALSLSEPDWDQVLDTNLKGTFLCAQAAARHMTASEGGRIVNLSSTYARTAVAGRAAYAASKAGVEQLTRALALEWAPAGITVNAVAPTTVLTESRAVLFDDEVVRRDRLARIPLGRFAEPEDVVGAVLLLVSPAGGFITGQTVGVDGGFTLA